MAEEKTLKRLNVWRLSAYLVVNVAAFLLVNGLAASAIPGFDWTDLPKWAKSGVWGIGLETAALVLTWILGADGKIAVVFWKTKHGLPGCRAFSEYARRDPRIDLHAIEQKLGNLPTDPDEQNKVWYRQFYLPVQDDPAVLDVHRAYLLFRDMTAMSLLLAPLLGIASFVFSSGIVPWAYSVVLVGAYLFLSQAARNAGERFVCTVLARGTPTATAGQEPSA